MKQHGAMDDYLTAIMDTMSILSQDANAPHEPAASTLPPPLNEHLRASASAVDDALVESAKLLADRAGDGDFDTTADLIFHLSVARSLIYETSLVADREAAHHADIVGHLNAAHDRLSVAKETLGRVHEVAQEEAPEDGALDPLARLALIAATTKPWAK